MKNETEKRYTSNKRLGESIIPSLRAKKTLVDSDTKENWGEKRRTFLVLRIGPRNRETDLREMKSQDQSAVYTYKTRLGKK